MRHSTLRTARNNRGAALLLTLIFMAIFATMAGAMLTRSSLELAKSDNEHRKLQARLAAESGMGYALLLLEDFRSAGSTDANHRPDILGDIADHLTGKAGVGAGVTYNVLDPNYDPNVPRCVETGLVALADGSRFQLCLTGSRHDDDVDANFVTQLRIEVVGYSADLKSSCTLQTDANTQLDTVVTRCGVVSSIRVIGRGDNVEIKGPIVGAYPRWFNRDGHTDSNKILNPNIYPLDLEFRKDCNLSQVKLTTTMRSDDFHKDANIDNNTGKSLNDFHDGLGTASGADANVVREMNRLKNNMTYDDPTFGGLSSEDFVTEDLKPETSYANLPDANGTKDCSFSGQTIECDFFGKDVDDGNKVIIENARIPAGTNPYFKNVEFRGITYIECMTGVTPTKDTQNSVNFENCTFKGPVITDKPDSLHWNYNCMKFGASCFFDANAIRDALGGATVMAPNYNVNIGGSEAGGGSSYDANSVIHGLVVGGCVDIYNYVHIKGTVVSTMEIVDANGHITVCGGSKKTDYGWLRRSPCGANIGNYNSSDWADQRIIIDPQQAATLPRGMKRYYVLAPVSGSYREVPPALPATPAGDDGQEGGGEEGGTYPPPPGGSGAYY